VEGHRPLAGTSRLAPGKAGRDLCEVPEPRGAFSQVPLQPARRRLLVLRRRDWQICDEQVDTDGILALPLKPGVVLFFDALLPRGTPPPNRSGFVKDGDEVVPSRSRCPIRDHDFAEVRERRHVEYDPHDDVGAYANAAK